jgi:hypothetical protein
VVCGLRIASFFKEIEKGKQMRHLPENLWKSPFIKKRLDQEANFECAWGLPSKPHYWVQVPNADTKKGNVTLSNYEPSVENVNPHEIQQIFAKELHDFVMKEAHFDGLWIVGYTHPPSSYAALTDTDNVWGRLIMIWCDEDGDPQYTAEFDRPFYEMLQDGILHFANQAHHAHLGFLDVCGKGMMKELSLKEGVHQHRAALESLNGKDVVIQ